MQLFLVYLQDVEDTPIILVGNKCDLEERAVSYEQGQALSIKFNSCPFIEASAKNNIKVDDIFHELIMLIEKKREIESKGTKKKKPCTIL